MHDTDLISSKDEKNKQYRNLIVIASIMICILLVLYWLLGGNNQSKKVETKKLENIPLVNPVEHIDAQSVWMERAQNELRDVQKNTSELKQAVEKIQDGNSNGKTASDPQYIALQEQVEALKKIVEAQNDKTESTKSDNTVVNSGQIFSTASGSTTQTTNIVSENPGIENDVINLKSKLGTSLPAKNADTYVPAGTFAEAKMLGGADASAGVNSQSKPIPMTFRITSDGTLPNHKKSHLKNCIVIGAVTGDISSERGEIRIERISCVFPTGEIVEQVVEGTVYGEDGKNGMRGIPVWREEAVVGRAAVAGALKGFSTGVAQSTVTNSISPLGSTQTVNQGEIFKNMFANGTTSSSETLADYNIKRAEQYHPVIQISAARKVDILFLKGFYLDGKKHSDLEQETNTPPEEITNTSTGSEQTSSQLTLTENQLKKINENERLFNK